MLDGAGHRIGFSAGRLHAGIQAGASPCSDSRNEYKKIPVLNGMRLSFVFAIALEPLKAIASRCPDYLF